MNLTTRYMGLTLRNPLVASASPLSQSVDTIRRLEDHGASAVVMFSLFEERIQHDLAAMEHFMAFGTESFGEALSYFPAVDDFDCRDEHVRAAAAGAPRFSRGSSPSSTTGWRRRATSRSISCAGR